MNFFDAAPFSYCSSFVIDSKIAITSSVVRLLLTSGPAKVVGDVTFIVVDTVKRKVSRAWAGQVLGAWAKMICDVGMKLFKVSQPLRVYFNAASTVNFVAFVIGIAATMANQIPGSKQVGLRKAVGGSEPSSIFCKTTSITAGRGAASPKIAATGHREVAAVATAFPHCIAFGVVRRSSDDNQMAETFISQIDHELTWAGHNFSPLYEIKLYTEKKSVVNVNC